MEPRRREGHPGKRLKIEEIAARVPSEFFRRWSDFLATGLSNGEYLVLVEEDWRWKNLLYYSTT
ncbi:MAG: hypothetical protein ABI680_10595 [Chthoniobacteraceae bacterium]